jgi:hypothetical protein
MLGVEEVRVVVAGSFSWRERWWDTMQYAFEDFAAKIEETNPKARIIMMSPHVGTVDRMALTMARGRLGWTTEIHQARGWGSRRASMSHMMKYGGAKHALFFTVKSEFGDPWTELGVRMAERYDVSTLVTYPLDDLELLAKKAFIDPPHLGST